MFPLLCKVGGQWVSSYSVLTVAGYLIGTLWLRTQLEHLKTTPRVFWSLVATVLTAAVLGGKLGYFLVEWRDFVADPAGMLREWNTGWVFWTGLLAAMASGLAFQAWHNATHRPRLYLPVADYVVTALPLGHFFGRLGCFLEGCCHGRPTSLPWAVTFTSPAAGVADELLGVPVHPTQLYEAAGELGLFVFFGYWVLPRVRAAKLRYGTAFLGYTAAYSLLRFLVETLRGDDRGMLLSAALSPSQWLSLAAGLAAAAALRSRGVVERAPAERTLYADGKP
ncbi:MAG: prolipoprotein diacylglyceryl transferase [Elusimicrobiota bacterium]|nr:prolipoprotein diacylglyceryl transferase [Elusimicrobiota bacterium]